MCDIVTCTLRYAIQYSLSGITPLKVSGWATKVRVVGSRKKLKVVVAVYTAEHQISSGVEITCESSSQWWFIYRAPCDTER